MGIKVKHSPSAAVIGQSAYTIGREDKRRWATGIDLKEQALGLQAASIGASSKARSAALKQRGVESERLHGLREEELEFRQQQYEDEPARQLQRGLEQQKLLRGQESYEYTEAQKRRRAQVIEGVNWLREQVASGKWTAEQAEQAEQQLWGLFHKIIPGLVDVGPGVQQRFDSSIATALDGSQWREESPGKFERMGMSEAEWDKSYDASYKTLTSANDGFAPTPQEVEKYMKSKRAMFAQYQAITTQTKEEKIRLQEKEKQDAAEEEQRVEMEAAVEALPVMFENISKGQPKIGRKKKGQPSWYRDDVYGEEAYNMMLTEAVNRSEQVGIPPEEVKAEFDKWWDEQHDKDRGKRLQKFGNRMEFEGAAPASQEEFIRTIQGMTDKEKAKAYYDKWVSKWR